jgi:hypothetical protein
MISRRTSPSRLLVISVLLSGCGGGGDGLPRQPVSGQVTLGDKPLPGGTIQFLPEGGGVSGGGTIADGSYEIRRESGLTPGKYTVSISSAAEGSPAASDTPGPAPRLAKEAIPERYNRKSTLTAEVKADGSNTFDFKLDPK